MELPSPRSEQGLSRAGLVLWLYGALALVALLVSAGRGDPDLYRTGETTGLSLATSPLVGLVVGLAVVAASRFAVQRFRWAKNLHTSFRELLGPMTHREILIIASASAIGEEFLFRGMLMPMTGVWVQAVLFALLHVGPSRRLLPWTISALGIGLAFGGLTLWTGDLGAAIVAHFVINYLNLHFIARTPAPA